MGGNLAPSRETDISSHCAKKLTTSYEEEYFDHDLDYEEKFTEWLELREGFIVAALAKKSDILGIGDAVILDIEKHVLKRTPRVMRLISYQGCTYQPQDYITYFEDMLAQIESFKDSLIKKSLRC